MSNTCLLDFKVFWSFHWRIALGTFIVLLVPIPIVAIFGLSGASQTNITFAFFTVVSIAIAALFYTWQWSLNCLPSRLYVEGTAQLMIQDQSLERYGFVDILCVMWSILWRFIATSFLLLMILGLIAYVVVAQNFLDLHTGHGYNLALAIKYPSLSMILSLSMMFSFIANFFAFAWMLKRKKTGRWIKTVVTETTA